MMPEQAQSQTVLAYWLLPAPPARDFFRQTIGRFAKECDAPLFEPHLTLAVGPDSAVAAQRILAGLAAEPIELHPTGIHFTAKFTQTLFVRFNSTPELNELRNSFGLERRDDDAFDPHVSLLYKQMAAENQAQLAAEIQLPFAAVTFNTVAATRCRIPVTAAADVAAWETIGTRPLDH
jgi:2'-5' RNA ligase